MPTHLFNAFIEAVDGSTLAGPVTVDKGEYLFVNKNTIEDIYFNLKKVDGEWKLADGPTTHGVPQQYVTAIGAQIDEFNITKE